MTARHDHAAPRKIGYAAATLALLRKARSTADKVESFVEGLLLEALDDEALRRLTATCYAGRISAPSAPLFDWEEAWFSRALPTPPSRVLVGGAGRGREVAHLLSTGYEVVAFEPSRRAVEEGRRSQRTSAALAWLEGGYEDLIARESELAREVERFAPYDAVLLGWGSFGHVVSAEHRARLIHALRLLCPAGPVLLSLWMTPDGGAAGASRARRLGESVARWLLPHQRHQRRPANDRILSNLGFFHVFTPREVEELARDAGYQIEWSASEVGAVSCYPHVTLRPHSSERAEKNPSRRDAP